MSGDRAAELTVVDQPTHHLTSTFSMKINNFKRLSDTQEKVRSTYIEIFPGKKIAFVVKNLLKNPPDGIGRYYNRYCHDGRGENWTPVTRNDLFLSVDLLAGEGSAPPALAGKVEIITGDTSQSFEFGNHQTGMYLGFFQCSVTKRSYLRPRLGRFLFCSPSFYTLSAANLVHVELTDVGEEDTLMMRFILFTPTAEGDLRSARYLSDQSKRIMKDESTADMKISCGEKDNKSVFNVHRNFFCARSPVFRAAIESDMLEGRTKEIYMAEVDERTVRQMIHYVYTGEFTTADLNIQMVALVADMYDLPGMMDLLCVSMKKHAKSENIADMLITAGKNIDISPPVIHYYLVTGRHGSEDLKKIAMVKLRENKDLLRDSAFMEKLDKNILVDIIKELEFIP